MDPRRQLLVSRLLEEIGIAPSRQPVEPMAGQDRLDRLSQQTQMLTLSRLLPAAQQFHVNSARVLIGPLDAPRLRRAIHLLLERHESLRTGYTPSDDTFVARVWPSVEPELPVLALDLTPALDEDTALNRIAGSERRRPFDLERGPLLRPTLVRLGHERHWLLLTVHHVACDQISIEILWRDLATIHEALANDAPDRLPLPVKQFGDFVAWQRRLATPERLAACLAWWRANVGTPEPPIVLDETADGSPTLLMTRASLDAVSLVRGLPALAAEQHVTPFVVMIAAACAVLHSVTGRNPVRIATPTSNRGRDEFHDTVGLLANTLVLPVSVDVDCPFVDLLARSRAALISALIHTDLPFETIALALAAESTLDPGALFRSMVIFRADDARAVASGPIRFLPIYPAAESSEPEIVLTGLDLVLGVDVTPSRVGFSLLYKTRHVPRALADRLLRTLEAFLEQAIVAPGSSVAELLSAASAGSWRSCDAAT